jgi:hypothetical protein
MFEWRENSLASGEAGLWLLRKFERLFERWEGSSESEVATAR